MHHAQPLLYTTAIIDRERFNRAAVRWWLYLICLMVFAIVIVGGATRLTDSGLSITEWKPIHGVIPPLNEAEWQEEFAKYRQIPEYQQINKGMSLAEFQFIFWWEWAHRLLGRLIGVVFAVPLAFFWWRGMLEPFLKPRLLALLALGGLQGFIGWWMVSSGLSVRTDVSQYRLAIHLTLACLIFAWAFWIARGLARHEKIEAPARLLLLAPLITIALLVQIFLGGLVAGLDAGQAFNDWPKMDGAWLPQDLDILSPLWLNWFENPKSVQFNHRIGGYILLLLAVLQWLVMRSERFDVAQRRRTVILLVLVLIQAIIGIATLMLQAPLNWSLVHQGWAVIVLAFAVAHWRATAGPYPPRTVIEVRE